MPSFNQIFSVAAFAGLTVAAPAAAPVSAAEAAPAVFGQHKFSISRKPVNHGYLPYGQHLNLKTHYKYNAEPPSHVVAAAAAVTGKVEADPSDGYDSSYLSPVTVGGTVLELDFDTGSSDLWVFSSLQPASQRTGHAYYTANSAKILSGAKWSISYGDGSGAAGKVYKDTVTIGGVTYSSQAVEAATSISTQFQQDTDTDGLVGLAFSSINTVTPTQQKTFFDNVSPSLASPIVVANLKYHAAGEYDFGFTDSSKYTGSISYTKVDSSQGFWGITVSGYGVGTTSTTSSSISAIADTGTTLIYLPAAVLRAYYGKVSGSQNSNTYGGYVFPCSATLPDLYLKVGSFVSRVPGKYINYAPVTDGSSTCYGGIQDSSSIGISILGDVWLKAQYVVFDNSATPRLGLAAKSV